MQADDRFENLMDYLTNRMPPDDRLAFEAELAMNQALREALETERQLYHGLLAQAIREQLTQVHGNLMATGAISKTEPIRPLPVWRSFWVYATIAASVLLIGGLAMFLFRPKTRPATTVAIPSKSRPPVAVGPKPVIEKSPPASTDRLPKKPVVITPEDSPQLTHPAELLAYNTFRQLTKTLPIEEQLATKETPTRGERTEFEELADGRLLLKRGTPSEAITAFKLLAESPSETKWPQWAQWYLAGAYLRAHQISEARHVLTTISNTPAHPAQRAAKKLLQKLN